ncbi:MAG: hypothetical protein HWD84_01820 [Flavobacteriaceae bacterium]|jgi:hypothetical protein|nr:hypothetical protein [Flavobacteriaceae bacterium]
MKTNIKILLGLFVLMISAEAMAQYGYGGYGYGRRDMYGRRMSVVPRTMTEMNKEPENLTAEQIVEQQMPAFKEALGLTVFEEAILSTVLTKYVQQRIELQILKLDPQKMKEQYQIIQENQEKELQQSLPPEKFEAYMELQEENFRNLDKKAKENNKESGKKKNKKKKNKG